MAKSFSRSKPSGDPPEAKHRVYLDTEAHNSSASADVYNSIHLSAIVCGLLLLELTLGLLIPSGFLQENELPLGARLLVWFYAAAVLIASVWSIDRIASFSNRRDGNHHIISGGLRLGMKIAVAVLLFSYVLSWATFWQIGRFIDSDAIRFWLMDPLQVFHWIDADIGATVIVATFIVGFIVFRWLPRRAARWPFVAQRRLVLGMRLLFAVSLFWTLVGEIYGSHSEQAHLRSTMLYQNARDDRATPLSRLLGNIRAGLGRTARLQIGEPAKLNRRNIISMEKYLTTVDRSRFKGWNVIIIIVESLRADQLRLYGGTRDICPTWTRSPGSPEFL